MAFLLFSDLQNFSSKARGPVSVREGQAVVLLCGPPPHFGGIVLSGLLSWCFVPFLFRVIFTSLRQPGHFHWTARLLKLPSKALVQQVVLMNSCGYGASPGPEMAWISNLRPKLASSCFCVQKFWHPILSFWTWIQFKVKWWIICLNIIYKQIRPVCWDKYKDMH